MTDGMPVEGQPPTSEHARSGRPLYICLDSSDDAIETEVLAPACDVRMLAASSVAELPDDDLANADVVAMWHALRADLPLLQRMRNCRAIVRMGVGYDNIDVAAAGALGIAVVNIPDYGTEEVADAALALILGLYRGTLASSLALANGRSFSGADAIAAAVPSIRRVRGSALGIVGLGRIGTGVALRAKACGFDVGFFDPHLPDGVDKALGVRRASTLEQLLATSECISLHCAVADFATTADAEGGADATMAVAVSAHARAAPERMIDGAALSLMRRGALLVNTARGELIDEAALAAALASGQVGAAALDVHCDEPYQAGRGPLAGAPNCFCTPHLGWYSPESRAEMRRKGAEAALAVLRGGELRNVVNLTQLDAPAHRERMRRGDLVDG